MDPLTKLAQTRSQETQKVALLFQIHGIDKSEFNIGQLYSVEHIKNLPTNLLIGIFIQNIRATITGRWILKNSHTRYPLESLKKEIEWQTCVLSIRVGEFESSENLDIQKTAETAKKYINKRLSISIATLDCISRLLGKFVYYHALKNCSK